MKINSVDGYKIIDDLVGAIAFAITQRQGQEGELGPHVSTVMQKFLQDAINSATEAKALLERTGTVSTEPEAASSELWSSDPAYGGGREH